MNNIAHVHSDCRSGYSAYQTLADTRIHTKPYPLPRVGSRSSLAHANNLFLDDRPLRSQSCRVYPNRQFDLNAKEQPKFSMPAVSPRISTALLAASAPPPAPIKLPEFKNNLNDLVSAIGANSLALLPKYSYVPSTNRRHSPEKLLLLRKVSNMVNYGTLPRETAFKLQVAIDHMKRGRLDLDAVGLTKKEFATYCRRHFKSILQEYKTTHGLGRIKVTVNGNVKRY